MRQYAEGNRLTAEVVRHVQETARQAAEALRHQSEEARRATEELQSQTQQAAETLRPVTHEQAQLLADMQRTIQLLQQLAQRLDAAEDQRHC